MFFDRVLLKLGSRGRITLSRQRTMLIKRCAVVLSGPRGGWSSPFIGGGGVQEPLRENFEIGVLKSVLHCNFIKQ